MSDSQAISFDAATGALSDRGDGANRPADPGVASSPSLRQSAKRASVWTIAGFGGAHVLRLGSNLVLTQLLLPEVFGIMAIVNVFIQGMQLMSDLGIGPSVIQNERGDEPRFLNTAWALQVLRGGAIWLLLTLVAWPASVFYGESILLWLIPVVGFTAVVSGFESTAQFTLNRHLALGRLTAMELGSQAAAVAIMIIWASVHPTIWALVAGTVGGKVVRTVWSHLLLPGRRNRLAWDRDAVRAVVHFGKWIFLTSGVGFLASQVDRLTLPKLIPFGLFGVYSIAYMLASVPDQVVASLAYKVVFPAVSKRAHLPRPELRRTVLRMRWPFLCLLALAVSVVASFGDLAVRLLYVSRYHDAAWMLSILALGLWPRMLTNTINPALLAIGQPRYIAFACVARFVVLTAGMLVGFHYFGVVGVVTAVAAASWVDYVVETFGLWRHGLLAVRQDAAVTGIWLALLLVFMLTRGAFGLGLPFVPPA